MLRNIKHSLTNPINAILGYSELILETLDSTENKIFKKDISSIHQSGVIILNSMSNILKTTPDNDKAPIYDNIKNMELQFSLRTPLSTIIGLTDLIIEENKIISKENNQDVYNFIEKINTSSKTLLKLIDNISDYSNFSVEEIMNKHKTDIYSKESSLRIFDFNSRSKLPISPGTILVVDDDYTNLDLIENILKHSDHKICKAVNAKEALTYLNSKSSLCDLILLDLIMPGMNGMELLEKLKNNKNYYHIPIIMLSALDEMETIVECIDLGADDFLLKPINKTLLNARINNALDKKYYHDNEIKYQEKIKDEQEKTDKLLLNILPKKIAERLIDGETLIADDIACASVMFADLSGFTKLSSNMKAKELLILLNNIFSIFDDLLVKHSLEKIKTIGDEYMLAGGIPEPADDHAVSVAEMGLDILDVVNKLNKDYKHSLHIRIGINSGPVSAGVIGKKKFIYDLWGDTVNVASRMETYGKADKIHISETTYKLLNKFYYCNKRKILNIPGKGDMQTYFLTNRRTT